MKEKFSYRGFDKVIGLTPEMRERPSELKDYIDTLIDERGGKLIEEYEVQKTDIENKIIDFVSEEADRILKEYDRERPLSINPSNIHVLKKNGTYEFTEERLKMGGHSTRFGSILIDRTDSKIQFALVLFHELMHLKSYKALQVIEEEGGHDLDIYRSGFSVTSRDGKTNYFKPLEEAVIGYLTHKFYEEVITHSQLFTDETSEMQASGQRPDISRMSELSSLNKIVDDIWSRKQDRFTSRSEIFELFIKAQVNGNLLTVGRLVEEVYGKGSLRKLGEINYDE